MATYFVSYPNANVNNQRIDGQTPESILTLFKGMYKELEKATVRVDGDKVTFVIPEGSKA